MLSALSCIWADLPTQDASRRSSRQHISVSSEKIHSLSREAWKLILTAVVRTIHSTNTQAQQWVTEPLRGERWCWKRTNMANCYISFGITEWRLWNTTDATFAYLNVFVCCAWFWCVYRFLIWMDIGLVSRLVHDFPVCHCFCLIILRRTYKLSPLIMFWRLRFNLWSPWPCRSDAYI